jgi:phosphoglycolate phosphatase-like HAD superfamily hydrolase
MFIISSNKESLMKKFLQHHNIEVYFKEILWKESEASKVKKFEFLFEKYDFTSQQCYFITDTLWDIKEGNIVWVESLAVEYWYHSQERMKAWNPKKFFKDSGELSHFLTY